MEEKTCGKRNRAFLFVPKAANEKQQAIMDFLADYKRSQIIIDAVLAFSERDTFCSKARARKNAQSSFINLPSDGKNGGGEQERVAEIVQGMPFVERTDFITSAVYEYLMDEADHADQRRFLASDVILDGEEFDLLDERENGDLVLLSRQAGILCSVNDIESGMKKWILAHENLKEHVRADSLRLLSVQECKAHNIPPLSNGGEFWVQANKNDSKSKMTVVDHLGLIRKRVPDGALAYIRPVFVYSRMRSLVPDSKKDELVYNVSDHLEFAKQAEQDIADGNLPVVVGKDKMIKEIIAAREMCSISNEDFLMLCKKHGIKSEIKIS